MIGTDACQIQEGAWYIIVKNDTQSPLLKVKFANGMLLLIYLYQANPWSKIA